MMLAAPHPFDDNLLTHDSSVLIILIIFKTKMNKSPDYKLNDVCRICLSKIDNMRDIMETNQHNTTIISMLQSIGHFEIFLNDFLPRYLCKECENKLELSYNFQKIVQKNNKYLMKCFNDQFINTTNKNDYRELEAKMEVPKEEPPDTVMYDQPSPIYENDLYDERNEEVNEFFVDGTKISVDDDRGGGGDGDEDPLEIKLESRDNYSSIPIEIREVANSTLLPSKSKVRYESLFANFLKWCEEKQMNSYSENCLLAYFQSTCTPSSLWSKYSMIKSCLLIHKNIDISKYNNLRLYIKKETSKNIPKKSKALSADEVRKFINEAPDFNFLMMKVALIIGISGPLRREELAKMSVNDIKFKSEVIFINRPTTEYNVSRPFVITDKQWIDLIVKYNSLRKENSRFFLTYRHGQCINSPVGINTFGRIPREIANFLNLECPEEYTGHCFRKTGKSMS